MGARNRATARCSSGTSRCSAPTGRPPIILQFIADQERGWDKMKGKRIALVYHDSPYGKEPIALLQKRSQMHGFETMFLPVTHPGVEQKATWLQVRQNRPDYVLLWGWGVMNSTAIKEAVAVGYPREKM